MTPQPIAWLSLSYAIMSSRSREAFRMAAKYMGVADDEFEAWAEGREWA